MTPPSEFNITISMDSDWHIGSGASRGEMDRTVQRDADHLPYIPAKTLTGILRDGCEQVAEALDNHAQGKWQQWVDFVFGSQPALANDEQAEMEPTPAVVNIHSAFVDDSLRNALAGKPQLKEAIALMKPGVTICPETGSAISNQLRFEEVIRQGTILTAKQCGFVFDDEITISEEQHQIAYALLLAGAKLVERIGGKRRRGYGRCTIRIDADSDQWVAWLKQQIENDTVADPPTRKKQPISAANSAHQSSQPQQWWKIPLTVTARSPLVLPKRTVGNIVECLDYIPGRYFLRYLHKKLSSFIDVASAIAQGNLLITNATIDIDGQAGRPTPLCLFSDKLHGGLSQGKGVYNRFQEPEPEGSQLQGERAGYLGKFDPAHQQLPNYETVKLELYTHNSIQDPVQRPTQEIGGIYSYEAIPADTTFQAELRIPNQLKELLDSSKDNWWEILNGNTRIGQSKKDQYGGISLQAASPQPCQSQKQTSSELYVWLLSDLVLRDQNLKPTTNPEDLRQALENELNTSLQEGHSSNNEQLLSFMARSRRTESWQVRWGLPRPSMLGWQAGSCVVYQIKGATPSPEKLAELEARGIGERRVEGYGQIAFNDPLLTENLSHRYRKDSHSSSNSAASNPIPVSDSSFDYARRIETAAWREAINNQALSIAVNHDERKRILGIKIDRQESHPPMSQLGGLRSKLRRLQSFDDQDQITSWITALENVPNRREKWDQTDNGLHKIRELVTDQHQIWQELNLPTDRLTMTVGGTEQLQKDLWAEAVRTLVDAMIRAHKRDLEDAQQEES